MNAKTINCEWDFVRKEMTPFNKDGTKKGLMLFEFQILLNVLSKTKNLVERQILIIIYQERKTQYRMFY